MHSPDRQWWWTGQQWVPAVSPDRSHWWNGNAWVPVGGTAPRQFRFEPTVHTRRIQLGVLGVLALQMLFGVLYFAFVMPMLMDQLVNTAIANSSASGGQPMDPAAEQQFRDMFQSLMTFGMVFGGLFGIAFAIVIAVGAIKLWRWVYWVYMILLGLSVLSLPSVVQELTQTGVYAQLSLPAWYPAAQLILLLVDLSGFVWMVYLLRKYGAWARRTIPA